MELAAAQEFLFTVPEVELANWLVWRPGWPEWQPVAEIPELFKRKSTATVVASTPPAPIERIILATPLHFAHEVTSSHALNRPIERRRYQRHDMRVRVIVQTDELSLRTYSKEISLGGLFIEAPIPERMFCKQVRLYIAGPNGKNNLRFQVPLIQGRHPNFFGLESLDKEARRVFESWLNLHAPTMTFKVS